MVHFAISTLPFIWYALNIWFERPKQGYIRVYMCIKSIFRHGSWKKGGLIIFKITCVIFKQCYWVIGKRFSHYQTHICCNKDSQQNGNISNKLVQRECNYWLPVPLFYGVFSCRNYYFYFHIRFGWKWCLTMPCCAHTIPVNHKNFFTICASDI